MTCTCGQQIRACQCPAAVCYGWIHVEGQRLHGCMTTPADGRGAFPAETTAATAEEKE